MTFSHDQVRAAPGDDPEVRPGQVWRLRDDYVSRPSVEYPMRVRVVCRYPFAEPGDGPIWVVESVDRSVGRLLRTPEPTLRDAYVLERDVEPL